MKKTCFPFLSDEILLFNFPNYFIDTYVLPLASLTKFLS